MPSNFGWGILGSSGSHAGIRASYIRVRHDVIIDCVQQFDSASCVLIQREIKK